jgi:hypothetical protein
MTKRSRRSRRTVRVGKYRTKKRDKQRLPPHRTKKRRTKRRTKSKRMKGGMRRGPGAFEQPLLKDAPEPDGSVVFHLESEAIPTATGGMMTRAYDKYVINPLAFLLDKASGSEPDTGGLGVDRDTVADGEPGVDRDTVADGDDQVMGTTPQPLYEQARPGETRECTCMYHCGFSGDYDTVSEHEGACPGAPQSVTVAEPDTMVSLVRGDYVDADEPRPDSPEPDLIVFTITKALAGHQIVVESPRGGRMDVQIPAFLDEEKKFVVYVPPPS